MLRAMPTAKEVEMEGRLGQLEWHARAIEARVGAAEQRIEATGLLADVPGEALLEPGLWGTLTWSEQTADDLEDDAEPKLRE